MQKKTRLATYTQAYKCIHNKTHVNILACVSHMQAVALGMSRCLSSGFGL